MTCLQWEGTVAAAEHGNMGRHEHPAVLLARSTLELYQVRRQSVTVDRKDARKDPQDPPAKIQPATNLV